MSQTIAEDVDLELRPLKQLKKRIKHLHQRELTNLMESFKNKAGGGSTPISPKPESQNASVGQLFQIQQQQLLKELAKPMILPTPKQVFLSMSSQEARSRPGNQVPKQFPSAILKGTHLKNNAVEVQKYFEDSVSQDSIIR